MGNETRPWGMHPARVYAAGDRRSGPRGDCAPARLPARGRSAEQVCAYTYVGVLSVLRKATFEVLQGGWGVLRVMSLMSPIKSYKLDINGTTRNGQNMDAGKIYSSALISSSSSSSERSLLCERWVVSTRIWTMQYQRT